MRKKIQIKGRVKMQGIKEKVCAKVQEALGKIVPFGGTGMDLALKAKVFEEIEEAVALTLKELNLSMVSVEDLEEWVAGLRGRDRLIWVGKVWVGFRWKKKNFLFDISFETKAAFV